LLYSIGQEHRPDDPWGRVELRIESAADGTHRASIEQRHDGVFRWHATIGDDAWTTTLATLFDKAAAEFVPMGFPRPGAPLASITLDRGNGEQGLVVDVNRVARSSAQAALVRALDGVVGEMSRGRAGEMAPGWTPVLRDVVGPTSCER
jgi:hypothetical protein